MSQTGKFRWRSGWAGAALAVAVGWLFWATRLGDGLEGLSYDLLFLFKPDVHPQGVVIVYMDEESHSKLNQDPRSWDRILHARLLDRLTEDQARLVVFDVFFTDPGTTSANREFSKAIKANGKVVLAATLGSDRRRGAVAFPVYRPLPEFLTNATGWGITGPLPGGIIRQYAANSAQGPSLAWAAAGAAGKKFTPRQEASWSAGWLNFYGPHAAIPGVSYWDVSKQDPGFFRDKVVFVGGRLETQHLGVVADEFRTPSSRWGSGPFPGVELAATAFLNLERTDWLTRLPWLMEFLLLVACGSLAGYGGARTKPLLFLGLAGAGLFGIVVLAILLHWLANAWFSWLVLAGVQIPCTLAWTLLARVKVDFKTTPEPVSEPGIGPGGTQRIPIIPDHTLIRCVGKGGYGEVWLARNAIGLYHAAKIVYRRSFASPDPYEREFRGIQKFMPISLNHPWLVHVLHVGRNDAEGYFYYIMEAADDEVSGAAIDPAAYVPKSLSGEICKRHRFPLAECVELGLQLTAALDYMHKCSLIHRDIKPANIIYVGGIPKITDPGLVTDIRGEGKDVSYYGTEGYIPPEGPGTPGGDIYGLGKVLYEVSMGRDRHDFPELPPSLIERPDTLLLMQFNKVILKACEIDPSRRYRSAAEMNADLAVLAKCPRP